MQKQLDTYHLHPGEVFVTKNQMVISTVLGSCVAVCLWDEKTRTGGMNHVVYPLQREDDILSTRFANIGTWVLHDLMKAEKAFRRSITARIFGGASGVGALKEGTELSVGNRNIEVVQQALEKIGIPIVGQDIGGHTGRKIYFNIMTGKIRMSYLRRYNFTAERITTQKI